MARRWEAHLHPELQTPFIQAPVALATRDAYEVTAIWALRITRTRVQRNGTRRLERAYKATAHFIGPNADIIDQGGEVVARGTCNDWREAIEDMRHVGYMAPALRVFGRRIFDPKHWSSIRPFHITFPFTRIDEPNAQYSPFTFVGPTFDAETDGETISLWNPTSWAAKDYVERHGGNAYLRGPTAAGEYQLWHRNKMLSHDVFDIDEWRARIIASTRD